ncbi:MAG: bifunctional 4-hydroxy-2-oxoglutarate aldolase/2-dehydro-3-deoxy-phosphogluconate aldolase [Ignavibacteriae bacterium]|nr:bifunctional 4-hydroxy-2-oxoglutarate aldolase/2-dehydro-3-deoxy-phosphogluconate aldolase [Ignavibacteriota bacterium]
MPHTAAIHRIETSRLIAVVRLDDAGPIPRVVEALLGGGISIVEITLTTPGAMDMIAVLRAEYGNEILLGAGSILNAAQAAQAADAGAEFLVSPVFSSGMMDVAAKTGLVAIPGAYTPTEILRATEAGADFVKVFPSDGLGPAFIKAVLAPMPALKLIPTGGVTLDNARSWIEAGSTALGLGSALVSPQAVRRGEYGELRLRASRLCDSIA